MDTLLSIVDSIKRSVLLKLVVIGFILLILMIPKSMIQGVVHERQLRRTDVISDISSKWGGTQYLYGPIIAIPYEKNEEKIFKEGKKEIVKEIKTTHKLYVLPDSINIKGNIATEERYRGIYRYDVFTAALSLQGVFSLSKEELDKYNIPVNMVQWDNAEILFGVEDIKGVAARIIASWNKKDIAFEELDLKTFLLRKTSFEDGVQFHLSLKKIIQIKITLGQIKTNSHGLSRTVGQL